MRISDCSSDVCSSDLLTSRIFGLPDDADQSLLALWANERGFKLIQTRIRQQGYCPAGQVTVVALLLFEDEKWIGATENIFDILASHSVSHSQNIVVRLPLHCRHIGSAHV